MLLSYIVKTASLPLDIIYRGAGEHLKWLNEDSKLRLWKAMIITPDSLTNKQIKKWERGTYTLEKNGVAHIY